MDSSSQRDSIVWDRRTIRTRGGPLGDQRSQVLEILGLWSEDHVDIASGPHYSIANQCDSADEHIANARAVEIIEDPSETAHYGIRLGVADSIAQALRAMPSASSSFGSQAASRMRR